MRALPGPDERGVMGRTGLLGAAIAGSIACLLLVGCGSPGTTTGQVGERSAPPTASGPLTDDVSGLIDVGNGRSIHLECRGSGSPTVILIAGAGVAGDSWRYAGSMTDEQDPATENDEAVFQTTGTFTRVCSYDRPGTTRVGGGPGRSTSVTQPVTTQAAAADLRRLLTTVDEREPVVLVAHSMGGLIATTYARTYPDDVAGLVLVDAASQFLPTALGEPAWGRFVDSIAASLSRDPDVEAPDYVASITALSALGPVPAIPVVVLSSDQPFFAIPGDDGAPVDHTREWLEAQTLLAGSLDAPLISQTDSGHYIAIENAALVNAQICEMVKPSGDC